MNRTPRTSPARFPVRLSAVTLAVVALTACGGEAEEPSPTPSEAPSATTAESPSAEPSEEPTEEPTDTPSDEPGVTAEVTIEGGSVTPVAQSVEVGVGEPVTLEVTSDRAGELHVHATPEQHLEFDKGRTTLEMTFDKPGAVDVEEHESDTLLLRVLVK